MAGRRIPIEIYIFFALGVYCVSAIGLNFTQDDAFITYRYVANFLDGNGLVYNVTERVEGFTSFGWLTYLSCWGALGADYILVSKLTGFLLGGGTIVLTYLAARFLFGDRAAGWALLPLFLAACNQSLAYWSPAGLETAAFAFLTHLAVYAYLRRSPWLIWSLLLLVWIRPDGVVIAASLIAAEWISKKRLPRFTIQCALLAGTASIPFVAFKLYYFGGILPNPFFAKVTFGGEQLTAGVAYLGEFLMHYGFLGSVLIVPLLFYRKLSLPERDVLLFTLFYLMYIVAIGGDVLKVHRFFVPVIGLIAINTAVSVRLLTAYMRARPRKRVLLLVIPVLLSWTIVAPRQTIVTYNAREKRHVELMSGMARNLKSIGHGDFSVATSTIGALGFGLLGHDVIDLLGLTDSTIARHPEQPLQGMESTWREHRHASRYLLGRAPDYIIFSTGLKPSSPAEQMLLLYREFREGYRAVGWVAHSGSGRVVTVSTAFKKVRSIKTPAGPDLPAAFVSSFRTGLEQYATGDFQRALVHFNHARTINSNDPYPELLSEIGFCQTMLGQEEQAVELLSGVLRRDSLVYKAHELLYKYRVRLKQFDQAQVHERWLKQLVPALWPWIETRVPAEGSSRIAP